MLKRLPIDIGGLLVHGGTMFYKIISFLVGYIVKKWHFCPKISKIRQYIEVILSETNDGLSYK